MTLNGRRSRPPVKVGTFGVNWVTNNIDPRGGEGGEGGSTSGGDGSDGGSGDSGRFESRLHAETACSANDSALFDNGASP